METDQDVNAYFVSTQTERYLIGPIYRDLVVDKIPIKENDPRYREEEEEQVDIQATIDHVIGKINAKLFRGKWHRSPFTAVILSYREQLILKGIPEPADKTAVLKNLCVKSPNRRRDIGHGNLKDWDPSSQEKAERIIEETLKYGSLYNLEESRKFVIGFCDFKNSTDLLSQTSTCYFRSVQNKLISRVSEIITKGFRGKKTDEPSYEYSGYIDKFAGDNVMFYFDIPEEDGEKTDIEKERRIFSSILQRSLEMTYAFRKALDEIAERENTECPLCGICRNSMHRKGCAENLKAMKSSLGLRIGLALTTRPVYQSVLGVSAKSSVRMETDYTFTGEDVNLASRIESLKEETMLADLDREKQSLDRYLEKLYDVKGVEQTRVMKERESINILIDDIYNIASSVFSIRINKELYGKFVEHVPNLGSWEKIKFRPKGLANTETIYILHGNECRMTGKAGDASEYMLY